MYLTNNVYQGEDTTLVGTSTDSACSIISRETFLISWLSVATGRSCSACTTADDVVLINSLLVIAGYFQGLDWYGQNV